MVFNVRFKHFWNTKENRNLAAKKLRYIMKKAKIEELDKTLVALGLTYELYQQSNLVSAHPLPSRPSSSPFPPPAAPRGRRAPRAAGLGAALSAAAGAFH